MLGFWTEGFQGLFAAFGRSLMAPLCCLRTFKGTVEPYCASLFRLPGWHVRPVPLVMSNRLYLGWPSFCQVITGKVRESGPGSRLLRLQICGRAALFSELPTADGQGHPSFKSWNNNESVAFTHFLHRSCLFFFTWLGHLTASSAPWHLLTLNRLFLNL